MASVKIEMIRGDTRTITATFVDSEGAAIDLTGGTVFFTVNADKEPSDDSSAVITKDVSSFTDPTTGIQSITLSSTDTNITPGTYYYDCQFVSAGGVVTSKPKSTLTVKSDITRRTA